MLLADRYELAHRIGSGGMAAVWAGRDTLLERPVAVKVVDLAAATDATFGERLRREAVATASLSHPDIVTVYDAGLDGRTAYVVMTLVDGRDLARVVAERGPLPVEEAARIGARVAGALAAAHDAGIVHRDVKPANVLLHGPDGRDVTVVDFGIAAMTGAQSSLTVAGTIIGTAQYMSPEQASGATATPASDVYALGCLVTTLLTGAPPFEAPSPMAVLHQHLGDPPEPLRARRPEIPAAIETLVAAMLAKEPDQRPTAAQVQDALLAAVPPEVAATVPRVTALAAGAGAGAGAALTAVAHTAAPDTAAPDTIAARTVAAPDTVAADTVAADTVAAPPPTPTRVLPETTGVVGDGRTRAAGGTPLPPSIPPRGAAGAPAPATPSVRGARPEPPRRRRWAGPLAGVLALAVLLALVLWAVDADRRSSDTGSDAASAPAVAETPAAQPEQPAEPPAEPPAEQPAEPPAEPADVAAVLAAIAVEDDVREDLTRRWAEVTEELDKDKPEKAARKVRDLERRIDDLEREERISAEDAAALRDAIDAATADLPDRGGPGGRDDGDD